MGMGVNTLLKRYSPYQQMVLNYTTSSEFDKSLYNPNTDSRNHPMKREVTR